MKRRRGSGKAVRLVFARSIATPISDVERVVRAYAQKHPRNKILWKIQGERRYRRNSRMSRLAKQARKRVAIKRRRNYTTPQSEQGFSGREKERRRKRYKQGLRWLRAEQLAERKQLKQWRRTRAN